MKQVCVRECLCVLCVCACMCMCHIYTAIIYIYIYIESSDRVILEQEKQSYEAGMCVCV